MGFKWLISWIFVFPIFKVLTGIEIYGSIPKKGAYILACNHVSFLDPPVVGITAFREVFFLAKTGLFKLSRFFTWVIKKYNALPISSTQGLRSAVKILKKGNAVVVFPEGTRSRKGYMLPFNPGASYLSIYLGIPVIPVYITNSNKKVISLVLRINKLKIRFGKPIYPSGYKRQRKDVERFAGQLKEEVMRLR